MQDVNVVVVFYSRTGATEQLALAAAVGAVQGRANIRLRRLPDVADEATIARDPQWKENRERMNREYVAPRETDVAWADAIVIGTAAGTDGIRPEFEGYRGKIGAVFVDGSDSHPLRTAMERAGLVVLPDEQTSDALTAARLLGRRVAEAARSEKKMRSAG